MTLSDQDVFGAYTKLTAAMDLMRPTIEYVGGNCEESDPAAHKGIELIREVISMLAKDRNIGKDHDRHWEWKEGYDAEDWSARIRQGVYPGFEYAIHRQFIKKRYGIVLPEPVHPVTNQKVIETLLLEQAEKKGDFWITDMAEEHNLREDVTLIVAEGLVDEGKLQYGDSKGVRDYEFKLREKKK